MPTRSGKRPESITHAKAIDKLINGKVATRNIYYQRFRPRRWRWRGWRCWAPSRPLYCPSHCYCSFRSFLIPPRGAQNEELVEKIATALDPDAQRARDEAQANRPLHTAQIFTLTQLLRDAHATNESLRSEVSALGDPPRTVGVDPYYSRGPRRIFWSKSRLVNASTVPYSQFPCHTIACHALESFFIFFGLTIASLASGVCLIHVSLASNFPTLVCSRCQKFV